MWEERDGDDYICVLVKNGGIGGENVMFMMGNEEWDDVVKRNVKGFLYMRRGVLKDMMGGKGGGRIIKM